MRTRIGDIFAVQLNSGLVRLFQYVANDQTQLGSAVVRVFRETHEPNEALISSKVVSGEVEFYAHVFLAVGLRMQLWRKVDHAQPPEHLNVLFRDTSDAGNPEVKISKKWYVWKIDGPFETLGELGPRYRRAEIGVVVPPDSLIYRMENGRYDFVYPGY